MALRGEKRATKDVDVVIPNASHFSRFVHAIENAGFTRPTLLERAYRDMDALVYEHPAGYRLDIFGKRICRKIIVHPPLLGRAEVYRELSRLRVLLMSREDIFLAKSLTEREGDLDDMYVLYTKGLVENTILQEVRFQSEHALAGQIWEAFLKLKLEELEDRFDITVAFKRKVETLTRERILKRRL